MLPVVITALIRSYLPLPESVAKKLLLATIMQCTKHGCPTVAAIWALARCRHPYFRKIRRYGANLTDVSSTSIYRTYGMLREIESVCCFRNGKFSTFCNTRIPALAQLCAAKLQTDTINWWQVNEEWDEYEEPDDHWLRISCYIDEAFSNVIQQHPDLNLQNLIASCSPNVV